MEALVYVYIYIYIYILIELDRDGRHSHPLGMSGLQVREGGVNRAPKIWGGKGSIDTHH